MLQTKNDKGIQIRRRIKTIVSGFRTMWQYYLRQVRNAKCDYFASQDAFMSVLVANYHVIEKCLAMPNFEPGHGKERVALVCGDLIKYQELGFDTTNIQYLSALQAIDEYNRIHKALNYDLGAKLQGVIDFVLKNAKYEQHDQPYVSKEEFFKNADAPFDIFATSRHSCRAYSVKDIPMQEITECINLARTTPTACNRQPNKTYVISNSEQIKRIVTVQGGGRGFAEKANKLLIVTSRVDVFSSNELFEALKSGGMYVMNLLYALHYHHIGTCPLEWSGGKSDKWLRMFVGIPDNEEMIMLIATGYPLDEFKYVLSNRNKLEDSIQVVP